MYFFYYFLDHIFLNHWVKLVLFLISSLLGSLCTQLEQSTIRQELLDDFLPDELCITGLQFRGKPEQIQSPKKDNVAEVEVFIVVFSVFSLNLPLLLMKMFIHRISLH